MHVLRLKQYALPIEITMWSRSNCCLIERHIEILELVALEMDSKRQQYLSPIETDSTYINNNNAIDRHACNDNNAFCWSRSTALGM